MPKIFISYRHDDSKHAAGRLALEFYRRGKRSDVYFDVGGKRGVEFAKLYEAKAAEADVVLALVGLGWNESQRLDSEGSHVRREILAAHTSGVSVIPVLLDETPQPKRGEYPDVLGFIFDIACEKLRHDSFEDDASRLFRTACELADAKSNFPVLSDLLQRQLDEERERLRQTHDRRDIAKLPSPVRLVTEMVEQSEMMAITSQYRGRSAAGELTDAGVRRGMARADGASDTEVQFTDGSTGRYVGDMSGGKKNGYGQLKQIDATGSETTLRGQWKDGRQHGYCTSASTASDGSTWRYEGEMHDGKRHGVGAHYSNSDCYRGEFRDSIREGLGVYIWKNGQRYEGEWRAGMRHGLGVLWATDGSPLRVGSWKDDQFLEV